MAARKRKLTLSDAWKDKIRIGMLASRLYSHALGDNEMSNTQIKAADILLKKLVPDLARTEHTGENGGPVVVALSPLDERL
jgi:hypothetical protein